MARCFAWLLPVLALGACSEQQVLTYQGRPAATALECEAAFQGANQRVSQAPVAYGTGASMMGAAIGKSMARGMNESHLNACLARVANAAPAYAAPAPMPATVPANYPRTVAPAQPMRTVGCSGGGGVMQGGTSYCLGN